MDATTIKIDGEILQSVRRAKPHTQNLTVFVRELLQTELQRRALRQAALEYADFLDKTPEEQDELHLWEETDLATAPKKPKI